MTIGCDSGLTYGSGCKMSCFWSTPQGDCRLDSLGWSCDSSVTNVNLVNAATSCDIEVTEVAPSHYGEWTCKSNGIGENYIDRVILIEGTSGNSSATTTTDNFALKLGLGLGIPLGIILLAVIFFLCFYFLCPALCICLPCCSRRVENKEEQAVDRIPVAVVEDHSSPGYVHVIRSDDYTSREQTFGHSNAQLMDDTAREQTLAHSTNVYGHSGYQPRRYSDELQYQEDDRLQYAQINSFAPSDTRTAKKISNISVADMNERIRKVSGIPSGYPSAR